MVLLLGFALLLGWLQLRRDVTATGYDDVAVEFCRARYARAGTAADSAVVDLQRPIWSRTQAPAATTCASLRAAGKLR